MKDQIAKCVEVLRAGGTILYPTDTVWGLGCDAFSTEAIDKIRKIKQRRTSQLLIRRISQLLIRRNSQLLIRQGTKSTWAQPSLRRRDIGVNQSK